MSILSKSVVYVRFAIFSILGLMFGLQLAFAGWNLHNQGLLRLSSHASLNRYLITTGVFGILVVFPIMLLELLRKNVFFVRVWFEVIWVATFSIIELGGASAASAFLPGIDCDGTISERSYCGSSRALTGATWTITVLLLLHLIGLVVCTIIHLEKYPEVWKVGVREFPWFGDKGATRRLSSAPPSPTRALPRTAGTIPTLIAPKPRKEVVRPLWAMSDVETSMDGDLNVVEPADLPRELSSSQGRYALQPVQSLYPSLVASTLPSRNLQSLAPRDSAFLPAGQWPPLKSSKTTAAKSRQASRQNGRENVPPTTDAPVATRRVRRERPPPLDLSKISSIS